MLKLILVLYKIRNFVTKSYLIWFSIYLVSHYKNFDCNAKCCSEYVNGTLVIVIMNVHKASLGLCNIIETV